MNERFHLRRYLRFSLRTFLLATTVFCIWLGWNSNIVHQRRQTQRWLEQRGAEVHAYWVSDIEIYFNCARNPWGSEPIAELTSPEGVDLLRRRNDISWLRRCLGDEPVWLIFMGDWPLSEAEVNRIKNAFPDVALAYSVVQR